MKVGIPKESQARETRVAISLQAIKKLKKKGFSILVESGAAISASLSDADLTAAGVETCSREDAFACDIVFKIHPPTTDEIKLLKPHTLYMSLLNSYLAPETTCAMAEMNVSAVALELIPRTSRAQSMDVLSSQANIAGYRAVVEAALHYQKFVPMMMTSAGMAKPAKLAVLGVGVAGLQAIATARRLGANVEAYDVRPEVVEQIESLGAKVIQIDIDESGSGEGGYAKELSAEAKKKQQDQLQEKLKGFDIVVTTANIPGRKAPELVLGETVKAMRTGSVIVDMATANGGNCPLSEVDQVIQKYGVTIVGHTNYPALVASDSSTFFSNNLVNLLELFIDMDDSSLKIKFDFEDDIVDAALAAHKGEIRFQPK